MPCGKKTCGAHGHGHRCASQPMNPSVIINAKTAFWPQPNKCHFSSSIPFHSFLHVTPIAMEQFVWWPEQRFVKSFVLCTKRGNSIQFPNNSLNKFTDNVENWKWIQHFRSIEQCSYLIDQIKVEMCSCEPINSNNAPFLTHNEYTSNHLDRYGDLSRKRKMRKMFSFEKHCSMRAVQAEKQNTHAVSKQYGFIDVLTRLKYGRFDRVMIKVLAPFTLHWNAFTYNQHIALYKMFQFNQLYAADS